MFQSSQQVQTKGSSEVEGKFSVSLFSAQFNNVCCRPTPASEQEATPATPPTTAPPPTTTTLATKPTAKATAAMTKTAAIASDYKDNKKE